MGNPITVDRAELIKNKTFPLIAPDSYRPADHLEMIERYGVRDAYPIPKDPKEKIPQSVYSSITLPFMPGYGGHIPKQAEKKSFVRYTVMHMLEMFELNIHFSFRNNKDVVYVFELITGYLHDVDGGSYTSEAQKFLESLKAFRQSLEQRYNFCRNKTIRDTGRTPNRSIDTFLRKL